jgi:hypothetical protein
MDMGFMPPDSIIGNSPREPWIEVEYNDPRVELSYIRAHMRLSDFTYESQPEWAMIHGNAELMEDKDWIMLTGEVRGSQEHLKKLWVRYFQE